MNAEGRARFFKGHIREQVIEAELSWIAGIVLLIATSYALMKFDVLWVIFGVVALTLYMLPIASTRDVFRVLPWEMVLLVVAPMVLHFGAESEFLTAHLAWWDDFTSLAFAFSTATLGLILVLELRMFSKVRMNRPFSVLFVVMFTLAVSGFWQIGLFMSDMFLSTQGQGTNGEVMTVLVWNLLGGLVMGFVHDLYLKALPEERLKTFEIAHPHLWGSGK